VLFHVRVVEVSAWTNPNSRVTPTRGASSAAPDLGAPSMSVIAAASLPHARIRAPSSNGTSRASKKTASRSELVVRKIASAKKPDDDARGATAPARLALTPATAVRLGVASNLLIAGPARADAGGGAVGLLALLIPVAGFFAFQAGKGGGGSDDDDDPPPPTGSQDSKNYAKNLTIAGGQNRKRRNPPKPKNL